LTDEARQGQGSAVAAKPWPWLSLSVNHLGEFALYRRRAPPNRKLNWGIRYAIALLQWLFFCFQFMNFDLLKHAQASDQPFWVSAIFVPRQGLDRPAIW